MRSRSRTPNVLGSELDRPLGSALINPAKSPLARELDHHTRMLWTSLRAHVGDAKPASLASVKEPAIAAIRYLETELQRVLDGGTLHGLPNLGSTDLPLRGARLRGRIDAPLPRLERGEDATSWTLILSDKGALDQVRAERVGTSREFELIVQTAPDDAFVVEDLPALANVLGPVLVRHAAFVNERRWWLDELRAFAERARKLRLGA